MSIKSKITLVLFGLLLSLGFYRCGSAPEENSSSLDLIQSKKLDDKRAIRIEVKELITDIEIPSEEKVGSSVKNGKEVKIKYLRFRLCDDVETKTEECEYLARGRWMSEKYLNEKVAEKKTTAQAASNGTLTMGGIYLFLGGAMEALNQLPPTKGSSPFFGKIFLFLGAVMTGVGVYNKLNENPAIRSFNIVINNTDKQFRTMNMDQLITEIDLLGVEVLPATEANPM